MNNSIITIDDNKNLMWKGKAYKCTIGEGGINKNKVEGDNCTPSGSYKLLKILYRISI